jgi:transcriptional regulator with XRE-family HTH domain
VPKPNPLLVGLGRAIRATRHERQLSQEELGWRSGVHRNYVGGIERGERQPSVTTLARLAVALDVEPSQLLGRAERLAP